MLISMFMAKINVLNNFYYTTFSHYVHKFLSNFHNIFAFFMIYCYT